MKAIIFITRSKGFFLFFIVLAISFSSLFAQGVYLNPAAEADMYRPLTTASSTLAPSSTANFSPDNLMDGSDASWSEGVKGSGVGEYIQLDFRYPDYMRYVMFKNGYGTKKHWKSNSRIKSFKISNEEGESRIVQLKDTRDLQVVGLLELIEDEYEELFTSEPLYGSSFKFEILEVYPGDKWQDACITEMDINNWYSDLFQMHDDYIYLNLFREYFNGIVDYKGDLFIGSDWGGYIPISVKDGKYFSEITSGDGTSGFDEYKVFCNKEEGLYYMFVSEYESSFVYIGDLNEDDGEWGQSEVFFSSFFLYDIFEHNFTQAEPDSIIQFFSSSPVEELSELSGESLNWEDIWIVITSFRNVVKAVVPSAANSFDSELTGYGQFEHEVYYEWNGKNFSLTPRGYYEPTGGDLGEDEDF